MSYLYKQWQPHSTESKLSGVLDRVSMTTSFDFSLVFMLNRHSVAQYDSKNVLGSIEVFEKQCEEAWSATKNLAFPEAYAAVDRIAVFGMGGSALGADILKTFFRNELQLPIEVVNDYSIPAWVNKKTLAIVSSYSGTTEETVAVAGHILERTQNVFVVTTGGALKKFAEEHGLPSYIFSPTHNPSKQPRMAVGYSVMGMIGACVALGFISVTDADVAGVLRSIQQMQRTLGADVPEATNRAKQLAQQLKGKLPVFISSEFLEGAAHVFANQINENAKQFVARFPIPEMNHHLIEGLVHPADALPELMFVFITSSFYHPRNAIRHGVTEEIVRKQQIATTIVSLTAAKPLEQLFELLLLGSYTSLYLAVLNELDPSPIPNVNYLKDQLKVAN